MMTPSLKQYYKASRGHEIEQQAAQLVAHQQEMLRILSSPVIRVWPGVLALPIISSLI